MILLPELPTATKRPFPYAMPSSWSGSMISSVQEMPSVDAILLPP